MDQRAEPSRLPRWFHLLLLLSESERQHLLSWKYLSARNYLSMLLPRRRSLAPARRRPRRGSNSVSATAKRRPNPRLARCRERRTTTAATMSVSPAGEIEDEFHIRFPARRGDAEQQYFISAPLLLRGSFHLVSPGHRRGRSAARLARRFPTRA